MVRPSSCIVKGGILSSRRYVPTYQHMCKKNNFFGCNFLCPPCQKGMQFPWAKILKREHLDTRLTTGSFDHCHETALEVFLVPYDAMKDRLTTWRSDAAADQAVL